MLLAPFRATIASTQAQHPNNLEIEVRYGVFKKSEDPSGFNKLTFRPGVSIQTFSRLQSSLSQIAPVTITESYDEVQDSKGDEQDKIRKTTFGDGSVVWVNKPRPLVTRNVEEYGMRITVTQEIPIKAPKTFKPTYTRDKIRYSYPLVGGAARVDLTRVTSKGYVTYEVELEMVQAQAFDAFSRVAELILKIVQDTVVLYTEKDRREVTGYFNNLLAGHRDEERLDHGIMKQSRDIKFRDMVWGGLIGNEKTGYKVSHKVDGIRKLLIFAPNGIWLVHPPFDYTRLTAEKFPTMTGTVLDGELVPKNKRLAGAPTKQYWYIVFDAVTYQGDVGTQKLPHERRMSLAQLSVDRIESPFLAVNTMTFHSFNTPRKFFQVMRMMFAEQATRAYVQDGFMFTPESAEYNPKGLLKKETEKLVAMDDFPLQKRVITIYADNLKWKDLPDLTIDFLIRKAERGIELYSNKDGRPILFTGTREFPFPGFITEITPLIEEAPDESIVEFRWEEDTFVPVLIRTNKVKPNRLEIAIDIWEDIHEPITRELLQGRTLGLFNYYQSRIRKGLLYKDKETEETLLAINTGEGEEIKSWKNYTKVVAYEPNPDKREKLQQRITEQRLVNKVRIIGSLEEIIPTVTEFIGKVTVISLIYDVGSFWRSKETLSQLVGIIQKTFDPNGRIVFLILDGVAVQEMFRPVFTPQFDVKGLDLGPAFVTYDQKSNLLVTNYPGTKLEDTTERPAFIYDLIMRVPGLHLGEIHRGDTEDFLSLPEKMYSRLYSFGLIETDDVMPQPSSEEAPELASRREEVPSPVPVGSPLVMVNPSIQPRKTLPVRGTGLPLRPLVSVLSARAVPARPVVGAVPARPVVGGRPKPRVALEKPLSTLIVLAPRQGDLPGIGDDKIERLNVTWTKEEVYRIACIGDGSCFFHSYLKGFFATYQNNNSYDYRSNVVRDFRDELAALITEEDTDNPGLRFYDTAANGQWVAVAKEQEIMEEPMLDDFNQPLDYSLKGMVKLFTSSRDVGDEVYSFVTEIIGTGVYVLRGSNKDLYPQISVGVENQSVIIVGNGRHYELVAVKRQEGLQTLFDVDDPFLSALQQFTATAHKTPR